ncbi:unnamed protein product [Schistosoma mattheei]|uniref:Uncharacterized protein n=1 Tax=Schistosoma mattheei TaxID=31246 RepID=A0AA85BY27_9TREM|nr:unnamed protein product [Schistosoma mattheei]
MIEPPSSGWEVFKEPKGFIKIIEVVCYSYFSLYRTSYLWGLNVSLIFGFTNVALWAAGLWFIWKETPWSGNNSLLGPENIATAADGSQM